MGARTTRNFLHSLDPISPQGHAAHRHPYIYDPKTHWRGGEVAARQVGGYDMARRREDIVGRESTSSDIPDADHRRDLETSAGWDASARACSTDCGAETGEGHEDVFLPVAMAPAGCPKPWRMSCAAA